MKISPYTPLCFEPYVSDGLPCRHTQVWSPSDNILIQVIAEEGEDAPFGALNDVLGMSASVITWQSWQMSDGKTLYFASLSMLPRGYYSVVVNDVTSEVFRVTDDELALSGTTLIRYRFKDNRERDDVVSLINNVPRFFEWRVPGGFKDSGWQFGVTNEQFATQRGDLVELYAMDYVNKAFTLGGPDGVPAWYGEMLNRLLTCTYVYFDDIRFTRNESETPSMSVLVDGMDAFIFTQVLRQYKNTVVDEATGIVMMRNVDDESTRNVDNQNVMII